MLYDNLTHDTARGAWRRVGIRLAAVGGAVLLMLLIVNAESWAIRHAPQLLQLGSVQLTSTAGCLPVDETDDSPLPLAVLH